MNLTVESTKKKDYNSFVLTSTPIGVFNEWIETFHALNRFQVKKIRIRNHPIELEELCNDV